MAGMPPPPLSRRPVNAFVLFILIPHLLWTTDQRVLSLPILAEGEQTLRKFFLGGGDENKRRRWVREKLRAEMKHASRVILAVACEAAVPSARRLLRKSPFAEASPKAGESMELVVVVSVQPPTPLLLHANASGSRFHSGRRAAMAREEAERTAVAFLTSGECDDDYEAKEAWTRAARDEDDMWERNYIPRMLTGEEDAGTLAALLRLPVAPSSPSSSSTLLPTPSPPLPLIITKGMSFQHDPKMIDCISKTIFPERSTVLWTRKDIAVAKPGGGYMKSRRILNLGCRLRGNITDKATARALKTSSLVCLDGEDGTWSTAWLAEHFRKFQSVVYFGAATTWDPNLFFSHGFWTNEMTSYAA